MMPTDMHMRDKIPVAILGATGAVGQTFVQLLINHPWFEIVALAASERSAGKPYSQAVSWSSPTPLPDHIAAMPVIAATPEACLAVNRSCRLAFSGLDSSVAGDIEQAFAMAGYIVVSNSRNHRMFPHVPLLIPEVNHDHLQLAKKQPYGKGIIVTNPNCAVIGLAIGLKPIIDLCGVDAVHVVTMQAVSGAGIPGVPSLFILDNVIPHIEGEEAKIESEPLKILGSYKNGAIDPISLKISAQCNRVPVSDGHMACVSVKLTKPAQADQIIGAWNHFSSLPQALRLPSAPERPIHYFHESHLPQPRRHRHLDKGMAVSIGRLRPCPLQDFKFTLLSHNTIRGAAGSALLNAELLVKQGYLAW